MLCGVLVNKAPQLVENTRQGHVHASVAEVQLKLIANPGLLQHCEAFDHGEAVPFAFR